MPRLCETIEFAISSANAAWQLIRFTPCLSAPDCKAARYILARDEISARFACNCIACFSSRADLGNDGTASHPSPNDPHILYATHDTDCGHHARKARCHSPAHAGDSGPVPKRNKDASRAL